MLCLKCIAPRRTKGLHAVYFIGDTVKLRLEASNEASLINCSVNVAVTLTSCPLSRCLLLRILRVSVQQQIHSPPVQYRPQSNPILRASRIKPQHHRVVIIPHRLIGSRDHYFWGTVQRSAREQAPSCVNSPSRPEVAKRAITQARAHCFFLNSIRYRTSASKKQAPSNFDRQTAKTFEYPMKTPLS